MPLGILLEQLIVVIAVTGNGDSNNYLLWLKKKGKMEINCNCNGLVVSCQQKLCFLIAVSM